MITAPVLKPLFSCALGLVLLAAVGAASATLVTWHLQNVAFTDGETATGFFAYDTGRQHNLLTDFDIKVTGVAGAFFFAPLEYATCAHNRFTCPFNRSAIGTPEGVQLENWGNDDRRVLTLSFSHPLSDLGGTVPLKFLSIESSQRNSLQTFSNRLILSGEVSAIPEPCEALVLALGLAALAGSSPRRRHKAASS